MLYNDRRVLRYINHRDEVVVDGMCVICLVDEMEERFAYSQENNLVLEYCHRWAYANTVLENYIEENYRYAVCLPISNLSDRPTYLSECVIDWERMPEHIIRMMVLDVNKFQREELENEEY